MTMRPRNRSKWKAVLASPFSIILALVILFFLVRAAWNVHEKADLSADRLVQEQASLNKLNGDQTNLAAKTANLSTDSGIETEMREKYRAVEPGESVAVIVDSSAPESVPADASATSTPKEGFWASLFHSIGL